MLRTRPAVGRPAAVRAHAATLVRSLRPRRPPPGSPVRRRPSGPAGPGRRVGPGSRARASIGLGRGRRRGSGLRAYRALLPLRFFLGATFVYAGLDKVVDPRFLHDTGPGSIGEQLVGFSHVSPLSPLIQLTALQAPVLVGFLIALAEIAIGLAALTGLLYRVAAAGGFALSVMFWLTASWATKPYYYGPDLPYALGWLTIGLAGHGGLYVLDGAWDRWAGRRIVRARYGDFVPPAEVDAWSADPADVGFLQARPGRQRDGRARRRLRAAGSSPRPRQRPRSRRVRRDPASGRHRVAAAGWPSGIGRRRHAGRARARRPCDRRRVHARRLSDAGPGRRRGGKVIAQVDQVQGGRAFAFQVPRPAIRPTSCGCRTGRSSPTTPSAPTPAAPWTSTEGRVCSSVRATAPRSTPATTPSRSPARPTCRSRSSRSGSTRDRHDHPDRLGRPRPTRRPGGRQAIRSPAGTARSSRFSGGASGQAHLGSKAHDGW